MLYDVPLNKPRQKKTHPPQVPGAAPVSAGESGDVTDGASAPPER
jgi:hypothetical protein